MTEESSPEGGLAAQLEELEAERARLRKRVRRQRQEIDDLLGLRDELNARIAALADGGGPTRTSSSTCSW